MRPTKDSMQKLSGGKIAVWKPRVEKEVAGKNTQKDISRTHMGIHFLKLENKLHDTSKFILINYSSVTVVRSQPCFAYAPQTWSSISSAQEIRDCLLCYGCITSNEITALDWCKRLFIRDTRHVRTSPSLLSSSVAIYPHCVQQTASVTTIYNLNGSRCFNDAIISTYPPRKERGLWEGASEIKIMNKRLAGGKCWTGTPSENRSWLAVMNAGAEATFLNSLLGT